LRRHEEGARHTVVDTRAAECGGIAGDLRFHDGRVVRKQRAINLGRATEIPTKGLAERKLADKLAEVNDSEYQPRSVITVGDFVETRYRKPILPLRKRTTRHGYEVILWHHILPEFGSRQLN
jgi:hypothetical protein